MSAKKCDADRQMVTLVKYFNGRPTIMRKSYKDVTLFDLQGQSTCILDDMINGYTMTRKRAEIKHGCAKMLTRMSEIRQALSRHGIQLIELIYMSARGKRCKNFRLDEESIKRINELDIKTVNYHGVCCVCGKRFEVAGTNHSHFKSSFLPTLRHCCGKPVELKEVAR